jgi:AcrR family transcriptional regulator
MNICSKFNVKREGPQLKNSQHSDVPKWTKKAFLSISGLLQGGVNDRRVQKTQGLLRAALISLIAEKPYDSIAVKEILDRGNVGRSTFYMHFRDKDDLLVSSIYEMLGPVPKLRSGGKGRDRLLWFSLPIFEHHYRHAHAWGDRIGTRGRAILHEHLRLVLAKIIGSSMKQEFGGALRKPLRQMPPDLVAEYVASTFVLVLNWWLDNKMPLPPKEINDIFRRLILPTLAAAY